LTRTTGEGAAIQSQLIYESSGKAIPSLALGAHSRKQKVRS